MYRDRFRFLSEIDRELHEIHPGRDNALLLTSLLLWRVMSQRLDHPVFGFESFREMISRDNMGERFYQCLVSFEANAPEMFGGIFSSLEAYFGELCIKGGFWPWALDVLGKYAHKDMFAEPKAVNDYFVEILNLSFSGKNRDANFLSPEVCRMAAALLNPSDDERVRCIGCGYGLPFLSCYEKNPRIKLDGLDCAASSEIQTRINLLLFGNNPRINTEDIVSESPASREADIILARPVPGLWSGEILDLRNDRLDRFGGLIEKKAVDEIVVMAHALKMMDRKKGRAAFFLPRSFLSGYQTRKIRAHILNSGLLEAVLTVPRDKSPGSPGKEALIILNAAKRGRRVVLADGDGLYSEKDVYADVDETADAVGGGTKNDFCFPVSVPEIKDRGYSLNIEAYREPAGFSEKEFKRLGMELKSINAELPSLQKRLNAKLAALGWRMPENGQD